MRRIIGFIGRVLYVKLVASIVWIIIVDTVFLPVIEYIGVCGRSIGEGVRLTR